jgi:uncharacterized membrane protein YeaQ/YmgE (transglycosylase-associated protein family)
MFSLIWMLLIGLGAGCAAAWMMGSSKAGWLPLLVVGVLGSFVGGFLFRLIGFKVVGFPAELLTATVGAMVCIYAIRKWAPRL